jgi:hypothetical protein
MGCTMARRSGTQALRLMVAAALLLPLLPLGDAAAALPPYWQRLRELEAILRSMDVADRLQESPIVSVTVTGIDVYEVRTESCTLIVNIVDRPLAPGEEPMVGPRQFQLEIGEPECR